MEQISQRRAFATGAAKGVVLFPFFVLLGTALFMWASHVVGYLPYSDRPGPGWQGWFPLRHPGQLAQAAWFYLSWALFATPTFLIYGLLLILPLGALTLLKPPRWILAVLGGVGLATAAMYLVAALGWYIAIAAPPVLAAGVLGLLFGAWYLPYHLRFTPPEPLSEPPNPDQLRADPKSAG